MVRDHWNITTMNKQAQIIWNIINLHLVKNMIWLETVVQNINKNIILSKIQKPTEVIWRLMTLKKNHLLSNQKIIWNPKKVYIHIIPNIITLKQKRRIRKMLEKNQKKRSIHMKSQKMTIVNKIHMMKTTIYP